MVKPVPRITDMNRPFYEGALAGELRLQRCGACGKWVFFPRVACPHCLADRLEWATASGRGVVHSFAFVYRPQHPAFNDDVPIILAAISLAEGLVILSEVADCDPNAVSIGMPVEAIWERRTADVAVVRFRPRAGRPDESAMQRPAQAGVAPAPRSA